MIVPFRRIFTKNYELSQVQNAIEQTLSPVLDSKILDGVLLTGVSVFTANTQISHTLGRIPLGYIIVGKSVFSDIKDVTRDSKTLTLVAEVSTVLSLWIF